MKLESDSGMKQSDPLYQKYRLKSNIGHCTYGVVYEATCAETGMAKAIKAVDPEARKRDSVEIQVLQICKHPNIIKLEEIIDAVAGRPSVALVFPAYDMDLAKLIHLGRGCPDDFPMQNRYCIAQGLWKGLQYMHDIELLHRDIKPANILVTLGSEVCAVLADMGLACAVPHAKPNIVVGDPRESCMHRTALVCTSCYVAPELLYAQHSGVDTQCYGYGADVWSATVVSLELACLQRYCKHVYSPAAQLSDILCRLGKPPASVRRRLPSAFRQICREHRSTPGALDLTAPWLSMVQMGIQWDPEDRESAKTIASCLSHAACTSSAALPDAKSPAAEGNLASVRATPRDSSIPDLQKFDPCRVLPKRDSSANQLKMKKTIIVRVNEHLEKKFKIRVKAFVDEFFVTILRGHFQALLRYEAKIEAARLANVESARTIKKSRAKLRDKQGQYMRALAASTQNEGFFRPPE